MPEENEVRSKTKMKATVKLPVEANARLEEVRKAMGVSREDMASQMAYTYQVYCAIARGDKPLFADRLELLKATKANIDYIITGKGEKLNETKKDYFESEFSLLNEKQKKIVITLIKQLLELE